MVGDDTAVIISEEYARYTQLALAHRTFGFWAGFLTISSTILFFYNIKVERDEFNDRISSFK